MLVEYNGQQVQQSISWIAEDCATIPWILISRKRGKLVINDGTTTQHRQNLTRHLNCSSWSFPSKQHPAIQHNNQRPQVTSHVEGCGDSRHIPILSWAPTTGFRTWQELMRHPAIIRSYGSVSTPATHDGLPSRTQKVPSIDKGEAVACYWLQNRIGGDPGQPP